MIDSTLVVPIRPASIFSPELVVQLEPGASKADVLRKLVERLVDAGSIPIDQIKAVVAALLARERATRAVVTLRIQH